MDKPTEAQIKEFWERCGFKRVNWKGWRGWEYPDLGATTELPSIDLNNLFKYAVPKAIAELIMTGIGTRNSWGKLLKVWMDFYFEGIELESALFWALWQVKENKI